MPQREMVLQKIFSSPRRIQEVAVLVQSPSPLSMVQLKKYISISPAILQKDLTDLIRLEVVQKSLRQGREVAYVANRSFVLYDELKRLFEKEILLSHKDFVRILEKQKGILTFILCGVLAGDPLAQTDIVVVGEKINESVMARLVTILESAHGRELRYTVFGAKEFADRFHMRDAFVRNIISRPHTSLMNKNEYLSQFSTA